MMADSGRDPLVVFTPSGKRGRFKSGTPVLQAARSLGVDIDSVCGGRAICGRCQVTVAEGEFAKHGIVSSLDHLNGFTSVEQRYADKRGLKPGRRLSCQTLLLGDLVIDVPPDSQVHKQVVRKRADARVIAMHPATRLYYIEVEEPDMHKPSSDLERVLAALASQWGLSGLTTDLQVIRSLQKALRQGEWKITCAVHHRMPGGTAAIIAVWPGFHDQIFGMAVDVGSTTVAAHLCSLSTGEVLASAGVMNPQIRFGEDLMSRVSYVMMNPGGDREMTAAIRDAINALAGEVTAAANAPLGDVLEIVLVGNPVMHHLLLGIDPIELGGAPFALATGLPITRPGPRLDLMLNPGADIYVLPCIAGHVGADTAGVVLSEAAASLRGIDADRRCRNQCRDRARRQATAARLLLAHRPGLRGSPDLLRPARRARRHRAGADRSRNARAALSRSSAPTCGPTSPASRKPSRQPASPASAAPASSR